MSLSLNHTYSFDGFVLDAEEQVLLRDGSMVPLTPKVFETLLLLVEHRGSIVSKKTILDTLWPNVFVEESNITFNINKLRKALGDTNRPPLYIETVPRRGYRFKREVREVQKGLGDVASLSASDKVGVPTTDSPTETIEHPTFYLSRRQRTVAFSVFVALLFLAVTVVAAWRLHRASQRNQIVAQQSASRSPDKTDLRFEQISAYGNVVSAAISPDGKQVVYVQENSGGQSVWLIQLGTLVKIQLIPPGDSVYNKISFSHDGDYVFFVRHTENQPTDLYRIATLGGPAIKIHQDVQGSYSFSSDDRKFVFRRRNAVAREDTLFVSDTDSDQERPIVNHKAPEWIRAFALSPKSNAVVYATGETDSDRALMNVREVDVATGQQRLLMKPNWYFIRQFEWLPGGDSLLLLARENATLTPQLWRMSYPDLTLQKLTNDLNNYLLFSLNRDASKIIALQSVLASHIWISAPNGLNAKNVADGRGRIAWTKDGQIVYNSGSLLGSDLWIARSDGTEPKQLSFNEGFNDWPAVSPDNHTIVFQSNRTGVQHLWRMDLDGNNQTQLTNGYAERNAVISPDGKWVYYNSSESNFLWRVPLRGGEAIPLTQECAAYPSISPDGKLIATFHFPKHDHEALITVRNSEDMKTVNDLTLAPGFWISRSIQWDADSASLIYAVVSNGKVKLYRQSVNSGPPQELTAFKAEDEFEFSFSPNHKQLAFISTKWNHYAVLIDGFK